VATTVNALDAALDKMQSTMGGRPVIRHSVQIDPNKPHKGLSFYNATSSGADNKTLADALYSDLVDIGKAANASDYMKKYAQTDPYGTMLGEYASALLQDSNAISVFNSGSYDTSGILNDLKTLGIGEDHIGVLTGATFANKGNNLSQSQAFYVANAVRNSGGLRSQGTG